MASYIITDNITFCCSTYKLQVICDCLDLDQLRLHKISNSVKLLVANVIEAVIFNRIETDHCYHSRKFTKTALFLDIIIQINMFTRYM